MQPWFPYVDPLEVDYEVYMDEQLLKKRYGEGWASWTTGAPPILGRPIWWTQEATFTGASVAPFVFVSFQSIGVLYVEGVWVTTNQFRDLFSIKPEIAINDARIAVPQDASPYAPMGEGPNRMFPVGVVVDQNQTFQLRSQTMIFYTGQTSKGYVGVVRGWYL